MTASDITPTVIGPLGSQPGLARLSQRESQILEIVARGRTNRQVAAELSVTVHAIKFHLASIYRKLGVTNRTEAVVAFMKTTSG